MVNLEKIGIVSFKDELLFVGVILYCFAVTSLFVYNLPNVGILPPWTYSVQSFVALICGVTMITISSMWLILGAASLMYKPIIITKEVHSPTISAIIPAHNEEKVIGNLVSDLLLQTYEKTEIIVVAHNCTDKTVQVLKQFNDSRLKVFELNTPESGKAIPLNFGSKHSTGEIIAEFDSDNRVFDRDAFAKAVKYFEHTDVDAIQAKLETLNAGFNLLTKFQEFEYTAFSHLFWAGRNYIKTSSTLGGTGVFFRKSILEKVGYWDNELTEDYSMYCKLSYIKAKVRYAPDVVSWDEKPPYWSALFKQRSRWIRGHLSLTRKRFFKWSGISDFLYLVAPLASFAWYASSALIILNLIFTNLQGYWYPPVIIWVVGTVAHFSILTAIVLHVHREDLIKYIPLYYVFSFHWLLVFLFAARVNSWGESKTVHGFRTDQS